MSSRPESDGGLLYLEQKLGIFIQGPSQTRRNAALDILTGRIADERLIAAGVSKAHAPQPAPPVASPPVPVAPTRSHPNVAYRTARTVRGTADVQPAVDWTSRLSASPWLAASEVAQPRFRIERPSPPAPSRRSLVRSLVLAASAAGLLLIVGVGVRGLTDRPDVAAPAAILLEAPTATLTDAPAVVSVEAPLAVVVEAPLAVVVEAPVAVVEAPTVVVADAPAIVLAEAPAIVPVEAPVAVVEAPAVVVADPPAIVLAEAPAPVAVVDAVAVIVAPIAAATVTNPPIALAQVISTALPSISVTPIPAAPPPANALKVLLDERFISNQRQWPNDPQGTGWLADNSYRFAASHTAHFVAVGIPGAETLGDTVVTGWFRKVGGPAGGGYGLILRDQHPEARDGMDQTGRYYVFEVGDRGEVGVWFRDDDHWVDLLTWTPSPAVKPGLASNELTVTAAGDTLSFVVNGILVASQTDGLLHTGGAGVFVGGDSNEVALDRISVSSPR